MKCTGRQEQDGQHVPGQQPLSGLPGDVGSITRATLHLLSPYRAPWLPHPLPRTAFPYVDACVWYPITQPLPNLPRLPELSSGRAALTW